MAYEEHRICKVLFDSFLRWYPGYRGNLIHIPNEGRMTARAGARLNEIGRRAGVADYFLMVPRGEYYGLWLEVKTATGKVSENQKLFLRDARESGFMGIVGYGYDESWNVLQCYMQGRHGVIEQLQDSDTRAGRKRQAQKSPG